MLNAGWGCSTAEGEGKRSGEDLHQDLLGLLPFLVSRSYRTKARAGCERDQREREWQPAWVLPLVELQSKERKRIRREQSLVNSAEIQMNLKSAKFWFKGGDDRFRSVFKWLAKHPPSFRIFGQKEVGF
jgi:hypothetical protein